MKATMTKRDAIKIDFIKSLNAEDFLLYCTYCRIEDAQEIVRMNYDLPTKDMPATIKVKDVDFILFKTKGVGVITDFVMKVNNDKYEVYEMSLKAFNEYEKYMSNINN